MDELTEREKEIWDKGYSAGNLDGYFGVRDEWYKKHPEDRPPL